MNALPLAMFLTLGAAAAQTLPPGFPVVPEPLTLSLLGSRSPLQGDWPELRFFQEMRRSNLDFTFDTPPDAVYEERKNLILASGRLPDVFFGGRLSAADEVTYGAQGLLLPLEPLLAEHAPNVHRLLDDPALRRAITTPDGHIYALPAVTAGFGVYPKLWLNGPWLGALGLGPPTTIDEFYGVLKAFKTGDPNGNGVADEIPLTSASLEGWPLDDLRPGLLAAFGFAVGYGDELFDVRSGRVRFVAAEGGFRDYLAFMNRLYREGLLDPDAFTQDFLNVVAKGADDRLGVFNAPGSFLVVGTERDEDFALLTPLASPASPEPLWPRLPNVQRGTFAVSSTNPAPEATLRWVDYLYTPAGAFLLVHGLEGTDWERTPAGGVRRLYPEGVNPEEYRAGRLTPDSGTQLPHDRRPVFAASTIGLRETHPENFYIGQETRRLEPYAVPTLPPLYFTAEEQGELNVLLLDLTRYTQEAEAAFITGRRPLGEWDAHLETLERLGAGRVAELYQAAYERYLAAGGAN